MPMIVPKIIWQTHEYKIDDLPEHLKKNSKTWTNLNPGWKYIYHDGYQRRVVVQKYPILFELYKKVNGMHQADIWRYIVTYENGGVYTDMDSVCVKPLDYMLDNVNDSEALLPPMSRGFHNQDRVGQIQTTNGMYAIKKESNFMKNVLDNVAEDYNNTKGTWLCFIDATQNFQNIEYRFSSAWHDDKLKSKFISDFLVDDYGSSIKYLDFLKKYDLSII